MGAAAMGLGLYAVPALAAKKKSGRKEVKGLDLAASIEILNMWGQKPKEINELYTALFNVLEKDKNAGFKDVAKDPTIQAMCQKMGMIHLGGPMLGCITPNSVKVWVRTARPAKVSVELMQESGKQTFGPVVSSLESELAAIVPITGLHPNTVYSYKVLVDGKEIVTTGKQIIKTPPAGNEAETRIAFGTCPHRWGLGNQKQSREIRTFNPHAMLMYGDVAVQDRKDHLGMHHADVALRDFHPAFNNLVCEVPLYANWDDHDYSHNDGYGLRIFEDKVRRGVRKAFTQSWNNPYYGLGDEGGGIFTHTRIGCCDVIMTDNRYFREFVKKGQKGPKHAFLGPEQMAWLKKTLLACKGPFIIITCGTMWDDVAAKGKDSWGRYDPDGREEVYSWIEENKIPGVLFLSGDRHGARIFRIPRPAGHEFYEFEVASLGGRKSITPPQRPEWKTSLYGMHRKYAYGQFTFDPTLDDPTVTHRLVGDDGNIMYELTLKRSQLTP